MNCKLINGDCLIENKQIADGSVDLILWDLPYGTVKNASFYDYCGGVQWDNAIAPNEVFEMANRILRMNGKLILFSQEPYTTELIKNAIGNLPFNYRMIWLKDNFANSLLVNKSPVSFYEDILVFSKNNPKHDSKGLHPLRDYFSKVLNFIGLNLKAINQKLGHRRAEHTFYVTAKKAILKEVGQKADHVFRNGSSQFSLCTAETYKELIQVFEIDKMEGFKNYNELKPIDEKYRKLLNFELNQKYPSIFNLWQGNKYKSNIFEYKKDYNGYHPTQKPILLLEDLIKTYSNKGDLVADLTMGSGSCGVAAKNTKRRFVGIEMDKNYFDIAEMRINKTLIPPKKMEWNGYKQSTIFDFINV
jgi:site-specific DNA-methyltransferase (adenine-specific)